MLVVVKHFNFNRLATLGGSFVSVYVLKRCLEYTINQTYVKQKKNTFNVTPRKDYDYLKLLMTALTNLRQDPITTLGVNEGNTRIMGAAARLFINHASAFTH